jgi:hypothetical protein
MSNTITKVLVGIVAIGLVTALVLPGRQTASVLQAGGQAFSGALGTAITG